MKRSILIAFSAAVLLGSSACAQQADEGSSEMTEGLRLANLSFDSVDRTGKGYADMGDLENQRALIFTSQDADESGSIDLEEFMSWDFGFSNAADEAGRRLAYDTALKVVFSFRDLNGDGQISESEHRKALRADMDRADANHNAVLERDEFLEGFSILVAIRAALKPVE